jgi:hypothetical protein
MHAKRKREDMLALPVFKSKTRTIIKWEGYGRYAYSRKLERQEDKAVTKC